MPVIGFISSRSAEGSAQYGAAFRKGLEEAGYFERQNEPIDWKPPRLERSTLACSEPIAISPSNGAIW